MVIKRFELSETVERFERMESGRCTGGIAQWNRPPVPSVGKRSRRKAVKRLEPFELLELASGLARRAFSQIDFDHVRILHDSRRRTFGNFFSGTQYNDTV